MRIFKTEETDAAPFVDIVDIPSLADPEIEDAKEKSRKVRLEYQAAFARLSAARLSLEATRNEAAEKVAAGGALNGYLEETENAVKRAESNLTILELAVKQAKEREAAVFQTRTEKIVADTRAITQRDLNELSDLLSKAQRINSRILARFLKAEDIFGQRQRVLPPQLYWRELLPISRTQDSRLEAWRNHVRAHGFEIE